MLYDANIREPRTSVAHTIHLSHFPDSVVPFSDLNIYMHLYTLFIESLLDRMAIDQQ